MKELVFVSVAFGPKYVEQQDRLKASILDLYPNADLLFFRDELPEESRPFLNSLYGFKCHAINKAFTLGYKQVVWFDPAIILVKRLEGLLSKHTVLAVADAHGLGEFVSDRYLDHTHKTRDELKYRNVKLVGGSFYYFDFTTETAKRVFSDWCQDEVGGMFGSQQQEASGQLQGHRSDEACMGMRLYLNGVKPVQAGDIGYCTENDPIMIKKHFK